MPVTGEPQSALTIEQYLETERLDHVRHDLVGGHRHTIVETSDRHNRIVENIFRVLASAAEDTSCHVTMRETRLQTPDGSVYYPDVMVVCDSEPNNLSLEHKPCMIAEVVSPKTETIDRREKWGAYNRIPSLRAYLIVDQERERVERLFRLESGTWLEEVQSGSDGVFLLRCPQTHLFFTQIYAGV